MGDVALIRNDTVANIIVVEDGSTFADDYVKRDDNDYDRAVDVDTLANPVAIGYVYRQGVGYVPPEEITAEPASIPPDGTTPALVTYIDNRPGASGDVTFDVNGVEQDIPLANGSAAINVTSSTPGDTVTVRCGGVAATVTVEEA